jgi:ADP-heptose:LPS heptosyltransferase
MNEGLVFLESNTYLEAGNRLEGWFAQDIPDTDFHYKMNGALDKAKRGNYFIVNFSSYGTKKAWGYYETTGAADVVEFLIKKTGWTPIFIGGTYDDFTRDVYMELIRREDRAINLVGKTPDLTEVVVWLQQARFYFGACSGLMVLSNVLRTPVATYYPPFQTPPGRHLAGTWHDPAIPYVSLFWEGVEQDKQIMESFLKTI